MNQKLKGEGPKVFWWYPINENGDHPAAVVMETDTIMLTGVEGCSSDRRGWGKDGPVRGREKNWFDVSVIGEAAWELQECVSAVSVVSIGV